MMLFVALVAILLMLIILWDAFETIVLPRRVTRQIRLTRYVYRLTWAPWSQFGQMIKNRNRRESFLSFYGPLALLVLLVVWATGLIVGFALIQWALGTQVIAPERHPGFGSDLYMSGVTFFTLGYGDVAPRSGLARLVAVIEAAAGFGLLALVIGYLPVLYQAFSRREVNISLLDARAGSPPSAVEFIRRHMRDYGVEMLTQQLRDWEQWSAELMEAHLSYASLGYFRSQHENQSWVAALTTILDASALVMVGIDGFPPQSPQQTFAMARHAAVDLSQVLATAPILSATDRLPSADLARVRALLAEVGAPLRESDKTEQKLKELRRLYEPYVDALSRQLLMPLPNWLPAEDEVDAWRTSAWENSGR